MIPFIIFFGRNGRGLGVLNWETDHISILHSDSTVLTREERKKMARGDYIARECHHPKNEGVCTCCWFPKKCPVCGMCDKCGRVPWSIYDVFRISEKIVRRN